MGPKPYVQHLPLRFNTIYISDSKII